MLPSKYILLSSQEEEVIVLPQGTDADVQRKVNTPLSFFLKIKKVKWFWKKCPDCVHPWVNFFIQNVGLRVSRRKNLKLFHAGRFFLLFLTKYLLKCPNSMKPPLHWNVSGCAPEMRTSGSTVIKLNPLSVIILVCLLHLKNKTAR